MHKNLAYRQVNVYWTKSQSELNFEVILKITGKDDMAMISKITDVVSKEFNIHINAFNVHTHKSKFEGILLLNVSDTSQLNSLLGRIKAIKGIEKAVRINSLD
jgi:GTP pyrophosphokinase